MNGNHQPFNDEDAIQSVPKNTWFLVYMHLIAHYVLKMCAKHEYFTTPVWHQKTHLIKLINMRRKEINWSKHRSFYKFNIKKHFT